MSRPTIVILVLLLISNLCVGLWAFDGFSDFEDGDSKPALRIAVHPWPGYEFLFLAQTLGYFEEEGVNPRLVELSSAGDVSSSFQRGSIDIACGTTYDLTDMRADGARDSVAFYVTDTSSGGDVIVAAPGITSVESLRGKRIGLEYGSVDVVLLYAALQAQEMTWDDVTTVDLPQSRKIDSLKRRIVDALVTYPPDSTAILHNQPGTSIIFSSANVPNAIVDVMISEPEILYSRKREIAAVCRAFDRARDYYENNRDEALRLMSARMQVPEEQLREGLTGITMLSLKGDMRQYFESLHTLRGSINLAHDARVAAGEPVKDVKTDSLVNSVIVDFLTSEEGGR